MSTGPKGITNLVKFILGSAVLICGITLILVWRQDVVVLFRGVIGMVLALAGLVILYLVKE